jgi:predicted O-methyltransferase YrrM
MNFLRIAQFISHWIGANSRHGTHSPFVYQLIESCIYLRNPKPSKQICRHFLDLRHSNQIVNGVDHGNSNSCEKKLSIADLANRSAARDFESELLMRLVSYHGSENVLELGANLGKSTVFMAHVNLKARVTAVEGNKGLADFCEDGIQSLGCTNVDVVNSTFDAFFQTNQNRFDLIFIDGDHREEPTLKNYQAAKQTIRGEGPIVLHDIYWSKGMTSAWGKIKADDDATVTIDLFFFGLVYFRANQRKEHFQIRFPANLLRLFF